VEIEYRRDNVANLARLLKGNIHEELKERAQRALDESATKVGQQRMDTFRVRLEFHSFDSEAGREDLPRETKRLPREAILLPTT
jgi:hypothetical protein